MSDSSSPSSSSSSSDDLSFILKQSSDHRPISQYVLDNETNIEIIESLMKPRQVRQEKRPS